MTMNKILLCFFIFCSYFKPAFSQDDPAQLRSIYDYALTEGKAYEDLRYLCKEIGPRMTGSENAQKAVEWSVEKMEAYGFDSVWTQPVDVQRWIRGEKEFCATSLGDTLDVLAIGFSKGTSGRITAGVVEFSTLEQLKSAPDGSLEGKIAFVNQPMNPKLIDTFGAYGGCAGARSIGPSIASSKGAIAYVMRSLGLRADDFPHTGVMAHPEGIDSIPAFALSTNSAFKLSQLLEENPNTELQLESHCHYLPDVTSYNVVGQITGSEYPDQYVVTGGHLDSWDVGEGAHDDGTGVIQSMEALRILKELNIRPRHSLRCVFFMNEECGARGATVYAEEAKANGEKHIAAMESDRGGFAPRGFSVDAPEGQIAYLAEWESLFEPFNIHFIRKGYGGVDINPLKAQGTPLIGFVPDPQRYFDVHHTSNDVFENVNQRELELGAASMASILYLIDKHGIPTAIRD